MDHLIANSGLQFIKREIEFNPDQAMIMPNGKPLKYSFIDTKDFIDNTTIFNLLYYHNDSNVFIPAKELDNSDVIIRRSNGREVIDESGLPQVDPMANVSLFSSYQADHPEIYNINTLTSFRVNNPNGNTHEKISAFELLLDKWLPMPMFKKEIDGITTNTPLAWCRVKISRIGFGNKKGTERYRLIWAFDTQLASDEFSVLRPIIYPEDEGKCEYCLCNKTELLFSFLSSSNDFHAFSDYIAAILGIDTNDGNNPSPFKYKAFYIYFVNFIRLSNGAPEITLYDNPKHDIKVDLVLDIGNSRTCGVLFEEGDFRRGKMLELTDLSMPWINYENKTYDMRVVFRKADFGNDIVLDEQMFQWHSFVRIGEEARRLIYRSMEECGIAEKTTNYSSPKRYLWDIKEYESQWENLITTDDSYNLSLNPEISVPQLSNLFNADGSVKNKEELNNDDDDFLDFSKKEHHYSRSSLMTFAFIELFQHALCQINSVRYRNKWGNIDLKRVLRNVIITCPTSMPMKEQIFLRQSAQDAFNALTICHTGLEMANIIPSPKALKNTDPYAPIQDKVWKYDEASCCQLVYLYAEIAERYDGDARKFFEQKGHCRQELIENGYKDKALTIGSIDIGAGTTDIMICSYQCSGEQGLTKIKPSPLFWDSFYLAGDDILKNLVQNFIIEGKEHNQPDLGNISSAVTTRIKNMSDNELQQLPCLEENVVYQSKIQDICTTYDEEIKLEKKISFASNLIHDFFGKDSSMMGFRDRRCRNDFNTQISVPLSQKMLELLRLNKASKVYTFDEIFSDLKPADYLLNYFEHHFGFRFEELLWRFDPAEIANIVKTTMEPLMKQLALVFYTHNCDIIVLAGRPTSLNAVNELFIKYVPTMPNRLVRLNDYRVGSWFPTADGQGYFYDQKSVVAIGGMVGYLASHGGLKDLNIDFSEMILKMDSTANYLGEYNSRLCQLNNILLSPEETTASIKVSTFPIFIGCRQLNAPLYQARPLFAIYDNGANDTLEIRLCRNFEDKEEIIIEDATDSEFRNCKNKIELVQQSLVDNGKYWLDKGEFELTLK